MQTALALDTNAYSALQRGSAKQLIELVNKTSDIALTLVVIAELKAGFKKGSQTNQNRAKLARFLQDPRVSILIPDEQTAETYAELWSELATKGNPIPTNDVWIAALCLQHGYTLATSDQHFDNVPLLQITGF